MAVHKEAEAHYPQPPDTLLQRQDDFFTPWPHRPTKLFGGRQVGQWKALREAIPFGLPPSVVPG